MYLQSCRILQETLPKKKAYPFTIASIANLRELSFPTNITFFVGENGSGKSTLLEAIAEQCGFNTAGGSRHHAAYAIHKGESALGKHVKLSWLPKVTDGFFLRAETFYQFAAQLDETAMYSRGNPYAEYGGKSLHEMSHGESFLALFQHYFKGKAIYLLDEPEAALSPTRQLSLLRIIKELEGEVQFIIATHSPILLGYPGATIYNFDEAGITPIAYEETSHYVVTKRFLNAREPFLQQIFADE